MAATGFTPISLYFSATAAAVPVNTDLVAGELALNTNDGKLYFKNSGGTVTLLASSVLNNYTTTGTGTVLALATSPTLTTPTVSGYTESVVALGTVTTTATIAITAGTVITATLTASTACTFTLPSVSTAGKSFILLLKQAATTGAGTGTFVTSPAGFIKWGTAGAPTITSTAGKLDILTFVSDGTNWYGSAAQGYTY